MTGMDDLVTWLRAQLDDDERVARAAHPGPWDLRTWDAFGGAAAEVLMPLGEPGYRTGLTRSSLIGTQEAGTAEHIAQWDPARVLAEVGAKRRILDLCEIGTYDGGHFGGYGDAYDDVVQRLALPYADRPGYREEWRPQ